REEPRDDPRRLPAPDVARSHAHRAGDGPQLPRERADEPQAPRALRGDERGESRSHRAYAGLGAVQHRGAVTNGTSGHAKAGWIAPPRLPVSPGIGLRSTGVLLDQDAVLVDLVAFRAVIGQAAAQLRRRALDLVPDRLEDVRIGLQEGLRVLAPLPEPVLAVVEPRTALAHD